VDQGMVQEQTSQEVNFSFNLLSVTASNKDSAKYIYLFVIANYKVFVLAEVGRVAQSV